MPVQVVHDFLTETENGLVLTLYLSRRSEVEFAAELGRFADPDDDLAVYAYIRPRYPHTPLSQVRIVTGEGQVATLSYMSILADAAHEIIQQKGKPS